MAKPLSVTVTDNGPLKLSGESITLRYCGDPVAVDEGKDLYICRCGESTNAPFCDGTHAKNGFVAEPPEADRKEVKVWEGKTIRTFFNPGACMHAFYCKPLNDLRERELEGDADAAAQIARIVQSCPSGALSYESRDAPPPPAAQGPSIDIVEGGEVRMQCAFEINADRLERQPEDRATLCRCGLSLNKPWCDGRHKKRDGFR